MSELQRFTVATESLLPIAESAREVIDCPKVNSMYLEFTHDLVCETVPITFGWIFWCVVLYSSFGMLVFTFRGALFPSVPNDEYGEFVDEPRSKDTDSLGKNGDSYDDIAHQKVSKFKGTPVETGGEDKSLMLDPTYSRSSDSSP